MASLKDLLVMGPARFLGNTYHDTITTNTLTSDVLVRNKAHILAPGGGTFTTRTSEYKGFLKITLPCSWTNAMLRFYVDIYNHGTTAASTTYVISGYPKYDAEGINNGWLSTSVFSLGGIDTKLANLPVTFGHDGNYCAIYIGTTTTTWNYPQVIIRDLTTGFITSNEIFQNGWNISFTTANIPTVNSRIEKPHVAQEANHAKLASEADELSSYSLQAAGATNPDTNPAPHIWNPLTWTIKKNWGGGGGIYALADKEGYFFGIFQVKVRISEYGHSAFINNKKVDWLSTSHETGVPTLTLTEEIIERGNDTTAPEVIFRLYVTAPSGNRSYNLITITETKGNTPVRNANKVSSITPAATTEAPHAVSSSTAIAFMANKWTTKRQFTISSEAGSTGIEVDGTADIELKIPDEMSNFKKITFADVGKNSSIVFSRGSWNYISTSSNAGSIALSPGGADEYHAVLVASNTAVFPGYRNNVSLGTSTNSWYSIYGNTVYANRISVKYSLFVNNSEIESQVGIKFNTDSSGLYLYGNRSTGARGLYDSRAERVILINENNFIRFYGTANKADILATARTFTISSTAGTTTGTTFNGGDNASLIIPSTMSGFKTISGGPGKNGAGVFNITANDTIYISSGEETSLVFCRGGADTAHEVGRFNTTGAFVIKKSLYVQGGSSYVNVPSGKNGTGFQVSYNNGTTTHSIQFYVNTNSASYSRGIWDSWTKKAICLIANDSIAFNGTTFNASNAMYVNEKKVYHEGTIVYSDDPPDSPAPGMIWLKPLAQA